ncbi:hypothetical protein MERGE_001777 [Pneumocystis wakefieldiae]|uniref:Uncharacterized protein n=1 Tax=Pneumocystis wakefieldiae TaxID=38082 RepID=A0A899FVT7_9ASCO|nr:hypothetical protein MERGE_001777 [Pneumocystis wakefieldiae]
MAGLFCFFLKSHLFLNISLMISFICFLLITLGCTLKKMSSIYIFEIEHKGMKITSYSNDTDIFDSINKENADDFDIRVGYNGIISNNLIKIYFTGICTMRPNDIMCFRDFNSFAEKFDDSSESFSISNEFLDGFQHREISIGTCVLIGASLLLSLFNSMSFTPFFHFLLVLNFYFILSGTILLITLTFIAHITISSLWSISKDLNTNIIKINPGISMIILSWISCVFAFFSTANFLFILLRQHIEIRKIMQKESLI